MMSGSEEWRVIKEVGSSEWIVREEKGRTFMKANHEWTRINTNRPRHGETGFNNKQDPNALATP